MAEAQRLILASGSAARKAMLGAAGLAFDVIPAAVDEGEMRSGMSRSGAHPEAADVASSLAVEKALAISRAHPDALVIGADQVLALGRRMFTKAATVDEARAALLDLKGRTHELVSAVALAERGHVVWQTFDSAQMTMRKFTDAFLESYLAQAGSTILNCVGCYEIEGAGVQLFERIDGDYFTILGMPLLPLLAELRKGGTVME